MILKKFNLANLLKINVMAMIMGVFITLPLFADTAIKTKTLWFFENRLKIEVSGTISQKKGSFTLNVIDPSTNKPWTDLTAQHFEGTVEMTNMDMGITEASVSDGKPGTIIMKVPFSMAGPWKLNITVKPKAVTPETQNIKFQVN